MPPVALIDPTAIDTENVLYDQDAIRAVNPQRFEMEQLSAIIHLDRDDHVIIGFKDVRPDEYWVRGHMPDYPIMPGVMMCEAAAQLCSFYCHIIEIVKDGFFGFGGMEDVRFRGLVKPGDRLILMAKAERLRLRQTIFETQGFVDGNMVFNARIIGVPLGSRNG